MVNNTEDSYRDNSDSRSSEMVSPDFCSVDHDNSGKEDSNSSAEGKHECAQDKIVDKCNIASDQEESAIDEKTIQGVTHWERNVPLSNDTIKQVESDQKTYADSSDSEILTTTELQEGLQQIDISAEVDRDVNTTEEDRQNNSTETSVASALSMVEMPLHEESRSLLDKWQENCHQSNNQSQRTQTADSQVDEKLITSQGESDEGNKLLRGWSRDENGDDGNVLKMIRKAGVAVTGGALVAVGLPMIPMPTPGGVVVVGSGMALLATEFPAAQRALDRSRQGLAHLVGDDSDDDEEKVEKKKKVARVADLVFQDEDMAKREAAKLRMKKLLNPMAAMKETNSFSILNKRGVKEFKERTVNASNGAKKNVKRFIRRTVIPLMERMTSNSPSTVKLDRDRSRGNSSMSRLKQEGTLRTGSASTPDNKV
jgi:hypothetical protein